MPRQAAKLHLQSHEPLVDVKDNHGETNVGPARGPQGEEEQYLMNTDTTTKSSNSSLKKFLHEIPRTSVRELLDECRERSNLSSLNVIVSDKRNSSN